MTEDRKKKIKECNSFCKKPLREVMVCDYQLHSQECIWFNTTKPPLIITEEKDFSYLALGIFSFVFSLAGIILTAVFLSRSTKEANKKAHVCLVWTLVGFIVSFIIFAFLGVMELEEYKRAMEELRKAIMEAY